MISLIPFEKTFGSLFDDLETSPFRSSVHVGSHEDKYVLALDVPGMTKEDLSIEAREGLLTIRGSKEVQGIKRSVHQRLTVPKGLDLEKAEATVEHGVLTVLLPKHFTQTKTILIK
jgi:HSP20 family protein